MRAATAVLALYSRCALTDDYVRYGFKATPLSSRQENRLALIPSAPLRKAPSPIKTPPSSPPAPPEDLKALPPVDPILPKEQERIAKWERMMRVAKRDPGGNVERWSFDEKKGRKVFHSLSEAHSGAGRLTRVGMQLRERIYKGVPDRWRSAVWWTLIDGSKVENLCRPNGPATKGRLTASELGRQYHERVDRPSTHDIQIDLDVPRTISGHVMFHTRYGAG